MPRRVLSGFSIDALMSEPRGMIGRCIDVEGGGRKVVTIDAVAMVLEQSPGAVGSSQRGQFVEVSPRKQAGWPKVAFEVRGLDAPGR